MRSGASARSAEAPVHSSGAAAAARRTLAAAVDLSDESRVTIGLLVRPPALSGSTFGAHGGRPAANEVLQNIQNYQKIQKLQKYKI